MIPTSERVGQYMSPYISGVINPMLDVMQEQNQRQQQGVVGDAIVKGAYGGNRVGVAQAELARQQKLADNQALGQLYQTGYGQALQAAQADKIAALDAAAKYAGLGQTQMQTALGQTGAQLGAGTQQQQFDYQQYLNALAFPYQQQSWLASIAGGLAPSAGGTTTEQKPEGNLFSQLFGAGLGIAGLFRDGGAVPRRAAAAGGVMGMMPYANDNPMGAGFPSYMGMSGGLPYANDNAMFGSYIPKVAAIGGGGSGFPTISDGDAADPFAELSNPTDLMRRGASNIGDWLGPSRPLRAGYNLADGGVVARHGYQAGGSPSERDFLEQIYGGIIRPEGGLVGGAPLPPPVAKRMPYDPGTIDTVNALDARALGLGAGMGERSPTMAYAREDDFAPADTLSPANIERFTPGESSVPPVRVADSSGVVPFTRGAAFETDQDSSYSRNIREAVQSLAAGHGLNLSPDAKMGLLSAAGTMMSSKSPFALAGIGEGLQAGVETYGARQKLEADMAAQRAANAQTGAGILEALERAGLTRAQTGLTGAQTGATRYTFTGTPYGVRVTDSLNPAQPFVVPWGQMLPGDEGQPGRVANPADYPAGGAPGAQTNPIYTPPADFRMDPRLNVPEQVPIILGQSGQLLTQSGETSSAASQSQMQLTEMRHSLAQLPETGILVPGSDFESRLQLAKTYQTYLSAVGIPVDEQLSQEIAAGENLNKLTTRLGYALSETLGNQNAASIVMSSIGAVPGAINSVKGAKVILSALEAANQRAMDWNAFLNSWVENPRTGGSSLGALEEFNRLNPPELYAVMAYVPPEAISYLRERPDLAQQFNQKYGDGKDIARYVLSGR